jgi:hypothetical protein
MDKASGSQSRSGRGSRIAHLSNEDLIVKDEPVRIPSRKGYSKTNPGPVFVWFCRNKHTSNMLIEALKQTAYGEWKSTPRQARSHGKFSGCAWVLKSWGLTEAEYNAMQRVAVKLDPTASNMVWDEAGQCYV